MPNVDDYEIVSVCEKGAKPHPFAKELETFIVRSIRESASLVAKCDGVMPFHDGPVETSCPGVLVYDKDGVPHQIFIVRCE